MVHLGPFPLSPFCLIYHHKKHRRMKEKQGKKWWTSNGDTTGSRFSRSSFCRRAFLVVNTSVISWIVTLSFRHLFLFCVSFVFSLLRFMIHHNANADCDKILSKFFIFFLTYVFWFFLFQIIIFNNCNGKISVFWDLMTSWNFSRKKKMQFSRLATFFIIPISGKWKRGRKLKRKIKSSDFETK